MNSASIGIEIVSPGDGGSPPYPDRQIVATIALASDIWHGVLLRTFRG